MRHCYPAVAMAAEPVVAMAAGTPVAMAAEPMVAMVAEMVGVLPDRAPGSPRPTMPVRIS